MSSTQKHMHLFYKLERQKKSKARKTDMYPHKVCWMPFCRAPIETKYHHIPKAKGSQITDHMVMDILRLLHFITAIDFR